MGSERVSGTVHALSGRCSLGSLLFVPPCTCHLESQLVSSSVERHPRAPASAIGYINRRVGSLTVLSSRLQWSVLEITENLTIVWYVTPGRRNGEPRLALESCSEGGAAPTVLVWQGLKSFQKRRKARRRPRRAELCLRSRCSQPSDQQATPSSLGGVLSGTSCVCIPELFADERLT